MKMLFANGTCHDVRRGQEERLVDALVDLDEQANPHVTIVRSEETWLRATGTVAKGFQLEHQYRSPEHRHVSADKDLKGEEVMLVMRDYVDGDEYWLHHLDWDGLPKWHMMRRAAVGRAKIAKAKISEVESAAEPREVLAPAALPTEETTEP